MVCSRTIHHGTNQCKFKALKRFSSGIQVIRGRTFMNSRINPTNSRILSIRWITRFIINSAKVSNQDGIKTHRQWIRGTSLHGEMVSRVGGKAATQVTLDQVSGTLLRAWIIVTHSKIISRTTVTTSTNPTTTFLAISKLLCLQTSTRSLCFSSKWTDNDGWSGSGCIVAVVVSISLMAMERVDNIFVIYVE